MTRIDIFGAQGSVKNLPDLIKRVSKVSKELGIEIQLLDASKVYGREHLEIATERAIRAIDEGRNRANSLPVEVLLYASGMRQISEAMDFMGLHEGEMDIGIVIIAPDGKEVTEDITTNLGFEPKDSVLEGSDKVLDAFGISESIRKNVKRELWKDLILEKVALLDIER